MINVENDYEPVIYEQPIYSHIYQNHDQFLLNYYTRSVSNSTTKEKIEKILEKITEEKPTECSSTNNIYQKIPKNHRYKRKNNGQCPFFRKSKIQRIANTRP